MAFYRSLNDLDHVQYYYRANTLVCDHTGSKSNENECGFCKELNHEGEMWLTSI